MLKRMPLRERFLAAVSGAVDVPSLLVPDLSYWLAAHPLSGGNSLETVAAFHQSLGVMPYYAYGTSLHGLEFPGVQVRTVDAGQGRTVTTWETPLGLLHREVTLLPASVARAVTRYPVQCAQDLERLVSMYRLGRVLRTPRDKVEARTRVAERFDGYAILPAPRSPVPALLTDWAGVMNGVVLMADQPELCEEFFQLVARLCLEAIDVICAVAPPFIHVCDNLTSDVYTSYFAQYLGPYYTEMLGRLHAAGIRVGTHLDGTVRGLLPLLASVGFDVVEALTPAPVGDVAAAQMRALAGPKTVLWGGLPGAMFAPPWNWEQFHHHLLEVLAAWRGSPFILGIGDQLPPDGEIEFVRRSAQLLETA